MKSKGFTLIELLAVIVILAIIALIATPIILNIINDSKKQSNERSAELYLKAAELAIARKNLTDELGDTTCEVQNSGNLICNGVTGEISVEMDGTKPTSGTIVFSNGKITTITNLQVSDKYFNKDSSNSAMVMSNTPQEATPFSGTIYRNSQDSISIGESIIPQYRNVFCAEGTNSQNVVISSCDDYNTSWDSAEECSTTMEQIKGSLGVDTYECILKSAKISGLDSYETNPSNISESIYLKHEVKDNLVQESYVCIKYNNTCFKGADESAYGAFQDGTSETDLSNAISGNVKELYDLSSYFTSIGGNCKCKNSDECRCSSETIHISVESDGDIASGNYYNHVYCEVQSTGLSICGVD